MTEPYVFHSASRSYEIQPRMLEALWRYVNHGIRPGGFLTAVLANDFMEACSHADDDNIDVLPAYAAYIYNELPSPCHGSYELVDSWIAIFQQLNALNKEKPDATP